ncbi:hypothetical protein LX32DRAFT_53811 [Colletotrichum zoysiae]|uniref:Uncharacterized protein n=1 Tax=Colletotrichum zoysiae TaxID=1216348 RepID=A0AAD9HB23_9PEZI|nr:hypothetical protein LX32DRAFT_53811 [Colletotrichum zoysiae]
MSPRFWASLGRRLQTDGQWEAHVGFACLCVGRLVWGTRVWRPSSSGAAKSRGAGGDESKRGEKWMRETRYGVSVLGRVSRSIEVREMKGKRCRMEECGLYAAHSVSMRSRPWPSHAVLFACFESQTNPTA